MLVRCVKAGRSFVYSGKLTLSEQTCHDQAGDNERFIAHIGESNLKNLRKTICLVLALSFLLSAGAIPVCAVSTEPSAATAVSAESTVESSEAATEHPVPVETTAVPETTIETAAPEETTVPEETESAAQPEGPDDAALHSQSSSMCFGTQETPRNFHDVPLYLQTDYRNVLYGTGTVASNGSSITALAMAASFITGTDYLPDSLARRFDSSDGNSIDKMESAASALGLSYTKTSDWSEVVKNLHLGKIVLVLVNKKSDFTSYQHVLVLKGITQDEKIWVNDPYGPNYSEETLRIGYEQGFPADFVAKGFMDAWIFDAYQTTEPPADAGEPKEIPLYLQTDYKDTPYGSGTVATSGCALTCVSMVAAGMSGKEVRPDALARRFNNYEASNIQRLEAASTVMDLTYTKTFSWKDVMNALAEGKPVIVLLGRPSKFTGNQHTVVLTGLTKDNKILVNDPYGPNHKKAALKDGFAHGFPPEMLTTGFSGAWIYESYNPPECLDSRYPDLELTADEEYLIASIVWLESRGESFEGQQAVAEIILNRYASGKFADSITDIIMADGQFRTTKFLDDAKPGELQYKALEKALYGPNVLPETVYFFARKAPNKNVWGRIGGHVFCYEP